MKTVLTNNLGTRLVGESSGSNETFLLLHAGRENRKVWRPVMEELSQFGLSAVSYDQRGHGDSKGAEADGVLVFGNDAEAMLGNHPGVKILVGSSLGGFAAMLALQNRDLRNQVAGLVLLDVVPTLDHVRARRYLEGLGNLAASPLVDDILARSHTLAQSMPNFQLPVLLVRGGAASPLSDVDVIKFRQICPDLHVRRVARAGHLVARDSPKKVADYLVDFEQSYAVRSRSQQQKVKAGTLG